MKPFGDDFGVNFDENYSFPYHLFILDLIGVIRGENLTTEFLGWSTQCGLGYEMNQDGKCIGTASISSTKLHIFEQKPLLSQLNSKSRRIRH